MPDIYLHYGVGSTEYDSGTLSERVSAAAGSTYTVTAHPKTGWTFSQAIVNGAKHTTSPFSFVVAPSDMNVDLTFSQVIAPPPPPPPPSGEQVIGTIGTSCDLLQKEMFGRSWYSYRQRYTGAHSSWDSERGDAEYTASSDPGCSAPPPPPPKTVNDVSKEVDTLRGIIAGVSAAVQDLTKTLTEGFASLTKRINDTGAALAQETTERKKDILGIWDKLEGWLVERLVGLMLRALDREIEGGK